MCYKDIVIFVSYLIWDEGNVAHIARHNVLPGEVEEVCAADPLVQQGKKGRLAVVGLTTKGRMLKIILAPKDKEGVYYPVTAHPAGRKDRRLYRLEKGGEQAA